MTIQAPVKNRASELSQAPVRTSTEVEVSGRKPVQALDFALKVTNLHKSFRSGFLKRRIRGIEDVSFSVPKGQVFALVGHNGAGKTTTINCILDLVHAEKGEISIMGHNHRDPASRKQVGYLPERPYFFEHLTGRELLNFYARLVDMPRAKRNDRIDEVLEMVGMTAFAGRRLKKFSKGMLQRIGLAQAIMDDPDLLILDEPMSGLDPIGRREVRELLMNLKRAGKTIILSSHIVPDVEMIADTVGILKDGNLVVVKDLTELNHRFSYTGDLAPGLVAPDWMPAKRKILDDGNTRFQVESLEELRQLLNDCHREALPLVSLQTHRSSLEELFMEINRDLSPQPQEVAR